jgi:6,7-dimethyl-8-ribityllumazine synthase
MAGFGDPHMQTVEATGLRLGIVGARWHHELVDHMIERAQEAATACGVTEIYVARCGGSVELPIVAQALARRYDAVVALGVVIKGETAHFEYVCRSVTDGLTRVALDAGRPVAHGVLTVNTLEQAIDRAGGEGAAEDKGAQAMGAALNTAVLLRRLRAKAGTVGFGR